MRGFTSGLIVAGVFLIIGCGQPPTGLAENAVVTTEISSNGETAENQSAAKFRVETVRKTTTAF